VASWHPSRFAHDLRAGICSSTLSSSCDLFADQLAFFWIAVIREALGDLTESVPPATWQPAPALPPPLHRSNISSTLRCFTNYEPRAAPSEISSLTSLVLMQDPRDTARQGWEGWFSIVAEDSDPVLQRVPLGHPDLKYSLLGSKLSGPLSLKIEMARPGYVSGFLEALWSNSPSQVFLCEPPGVKRSFLPSLVHLWDSDMVLSLTPFHETASGAGTWELGSFYSECDDGCVRQGLCLQVR
jgi:hypothetical protein